MDSEIPPTLRISEETAKRLGPEKVARIVADHKRRATLKFLVWGQDCEEGDATELNGLFAETARRAAEMAAEDDGESEWDSHYFVRDCQTNEVTFWCVSPTVTYSASPVEDWDGAE